MKKLKPTWCSHYQSPMEGRVCKAGVCYDDLPIDKEKGFYESAPCFFKNGTEACLCDKVEYPSQEELQKTEDAIQATMKRFLIVIPLIDDAAKFASSGEMACPCCDGTLHWSKAKYNGHRRARCTTDGCINFIE